jgi:hypothetical protein
VRARSTLAVGEVFFAIVGHERDGHAFLDDAAARGAACLVVSSLPDDLRGSTPVVLVEDTTRALGRLAAYHRARFSLPVAAVTGSNGKTTTKEMMASVLGALGPVLKPESSFNNQWGLPLTLFRLGPEHRAAALELGANQPGEIAALAQICRPTVGIVTVVASAHTEFFGSLEGVQAEKSALVRAIPPDGTVVLFRAPGSALDCGALWKQLAARIGGRGGGRADRAEGKLTSRVDDWPALNMGVRLEIADAGHAHAQGDQQRPAHLELRQRHGVAFAGVIYGHQLNVTIGQCIRDLELLAKVNEPEDCASRVEYLPLR